MQNDHTANLSRLTSCLSRCIKGIYSQFKIHQKNRQVLLQQVDRAILLRH